MAQLPPKIPSMSQNWPSSFPHQRHHQQHSSMANFLPSSAAAANPPSPPQPPGNNNNQAASCWMDEFLDFSSSRRGAHRRSASDSIAFMESPLHAFDVEDCGDAGRNTTVHGGANMGGGGAFDRLDDEQLMSMFSDDISVPPTVTSSSNPSTPSDQNSNNDDNNNNNSNNVNNNNNHNNVNKKPTLMPLTIDGYQHQPKSEPGEVESSCDPHDPHSQSHGPPPTSPADPKRVKRILANRQSAQRSRVRKLQYISELERSVTSLQSEVSALSPRVAFLDHQRLILGVDNSALKQRIAALAQDKLFKDAHQEALKKEIERLRQVYHQKMGNANNSNNNNQNVASHQQQQDHHHNPADVMLFTDHKEQQQILS